MPAEPAGGGQPASASHERLRELGNKSRDIRVPAREVGSGVLCCIVEIVLESARLHGAGPREPNKAQHEASAAPEADFLKLRTFCWFSFCINSPVSI